MTQLQLRRRAAVPLAVAAVVLAVIAIAATVAPGGPGGDAGPSASGTIQPVGSAPDETEPTHHARPRDAQIEPEPAPGPTAVGGEPWDQAASVACAGRVEEGLHEVAQLARDGGTTSFWSAGRRWAVCDHEPDGSEPLVTTGGSPRAGFTDDSWRLRSTKQTSSGGVRFLAGGRLPWPVQELTYDFPDGHVERARFVRSADGSDDTWWVLTRSVAADEVRGLAGAPAALTVSLVGGAAEAFRLPWRDATCVEEGFVCASVE